MKTNLLRICAIGAIAAAAAVAQFSMLNAYVPFDFIVGNETFPAGRYTLDRGPAQGTVMIRSEDCAHTAIALAQTVSSVVPRQNGSLVFHRYGDRYFLSEVWNPGNDGRRLVSPSWEKELAVTIEHPHNATVAALR